MKSSIKAPPRLRLPLLFAAMAFVMALAGGGQKAANQPDDAFNVVTTIAPLHALTQGVMEGVGQPQLLMHSGDNPHHYSMRPADAKLLVNADVIICTSRQHEYYMEPLIKTLPERHHTVLESLAIPGLRIVAGSDDEHASKALGRTFADMHFWLDPINAIAYTQYIAEELAEADPAHAAQYTDNAAKQILTLQELDASIRSRLGNAKREAHYASYHPALAYFEQRYGIAGGKTLSQNSEAHIGATDADAFFNAIESGAITCMFQEPEFPARLMQAAASRFGDKVSLFTLDTLGYTHGTGFAAYQKMLTAITNAIAQCSTPANGAADAKP